MGAKLVPSKPGQWRVEGSIDYQSVMALRQEGERLMAEARESGESAFCFDFDGVRRVNTAGLSLVLCWRRWAAEQQASLDLVNLPSELCSIARISDLEELLDPDAARAKDAG